jgi:hypothetical protein
MPSEDMSIISTTFELVLISLLSGEIASIQIRFSEYGVPMLHAFSLFKKFIKYFEIQFILHYHPFSEDNWVRRDDHPPLLRDYSGLEWN